MTFKLKSKNEDFLVTEVPLMPTLFSQKDSKYSYIWIQKSGLTTFEALERIKNFFKLNFADLASQGLKDEDAITEQLISIKKILKDRDLLAFNRKFKASGSYLKIIRIVGFGKEPVKERMLHGNAFKIIVRNLKQDQIIVLKNLLGGRSYQTMINYYDDQRFGMPGGPYNTHLIGKAIIEGSWSLAYSHMKITKNMKEVVHIKEKIEVESEKLFRSLNPKKIAFFVSSYNSYIWNEHASKLVAKKNKTKQHRFDNIGSLHIPITTESKLPNDFAINGHEFHAEKFTVLPKIFTRNLSVTTAVYLDEIQNDELNRGKKRATLSFFLPPGCYATMMIKQIFSKI